MVALWGHFDERYLSGHNTPAQVSLPFLPDLHAEVEKEWKKSFSSRIYAFIPRRSRSEPEQRRGPSPSRSGDQRSQKASVVTRAPPSPAGRARGRLKER